MGWGGPGAGVMRDGGRERGMGEGGVRRLEGWISSFSLLGRVVGLVLAS